MDLQKEYEEETGNEVKSESSSQYPYLCGTGKYSDEYVEWITKKLIFATQNPKVGDGEGCYNCRSKNLRPKEYNCLDCNHNGYCY